MGEIIAYIGPATIKTMNDGRECLLHAKPGSSIVTSADASGERFIIQYVAKSPDEIPQNQITNSMPSLLRR